MSGFALAGCRRELILPKNAPLKHSFWPELKLHAPLLPRKRIDLGRHFSLRQPASEYGTYLFLNTGAVYGKSTLRQEVERLAAGTVLGINLTGITESVYWSPEVKDEITRLSLKETVDYTLAFFSHLMKHHLTRRGKVWADLTGGFDSRLVTMMMDYCDIEFKACCEGPVASPDVKISSRIARKLGWDYKHNILPND